MPAHSTDSSAKWKTSNATMTCEAPSEEAVYADQQVLGMDRCIVCTHEQGDLLHIRSMIEYLGI